ncbi:MAG TPA: methyl-accepting chemotaxis protein [Gammaproteobacteria bacterium]|nr:methyl-accepting chemotaxis protein [Gammaproteobacteria bacterium]
MKIEKFSLKALTVGVLLLLGLSSIALTLFSGTRYQEAALNAQARTLSRVIEVANQDALRALDTHLIELGQRLQQRTNMRVAFEAALQDPGRWADFVTLLNDSFQQDDVTLDITKVRTYDLEYHLVAQSSQGASDLVAELPEALLQLSRKDGNNPQPHAVLWSSGKAAYYSMLMPIGVPAQVGYLEIIVSPIAHLRTVQDTLKLPFQARAAHDGESIYQSQDWHEPSATELLVHHPLRDSNGIEVVELEVIENVSGLYDDIAKVRSVTAVAFLILTGGSLILAIGLFNVLLFRPVANLMLDMQRAAEGDLTVAVRSRAVKEFSALAIAFNRMTGKVREFVERERQHAEDVTGKVELIREVVEGAAHGNLTGQLMVYRDNDVISDLAAGIQGMLDSLNNLVARIQQSGIQVTSSATEIAATAKQQEATVSEQAATTNEIRATVTEISATSRELVNTMHEVTDVAFKTAESANQGRTSLVRMEETMRNMMEATTAIGSKLAVLSEKAGNINTVVTTINKVSDQTNLLSLNAAIEAEKAGEYGVGFAVVATEIRRLADQTAVATWDIEQMVKEMQSAVSAGVMGMEKFSTEVKQGVDDVRRVGAQLAHIIEQVENLMPRFEEVHEGMQSQSKGAHQISEAMVQLSESSQQTAESLRQSNGAIGQLNEAARRLQEGVSHFKVNG